VLFTDRLALEVDGTVDRREPGEQATRCHRSTEGSSFELATHFRSHHHVMATPVSPAEWASLFDADGRILDEYRIRKDLFFRVRLPPVCLCTYRLPLFAYPPPQYPNHLHE
jgi:hypothetical protein